MAVAENGSRQSIRMPANLLAWLRQEARREGRSVASLVRWVLTQEQMRRKRGNGHREG
jgi:hypothetical protein